jgi:hypothetical protein
MGFTASFIELHQPLLVPKHFDQTPWSFEDAKEHDNVDEHPLIMNIRDTILRYRLQSAAHYDTNLVAKLAFPSEEVTVTRSSRITVSFADFEGPSLYVCRPVYERLARKKVQVLTTKVQVLDGGHYIPLIDFLQNRLPAYPSSVNVAVMRRWWAANGKIFNWAALPTELKEQVIQNCVHQPLEQIHYGQMFRRSNSRFTPMLSHGRAFGIYEIVDKLGDWGNLLGVSHQVRAITLRLCFVGGSSMIMGRGFNITATSCASLAGTMERLGRYYQIIEPNSLPVDSRTQILADCYKNYPEIYPQLSQYAVFRHGIRRVFLSLDFVSSMHFFKVTVGGFQSYWQSGSISCEVFKQLPHLAEIAIQLPQRPRQGWRDTPGQCGPQLFHDHNPCPRMLHRIIYKQIAELLAIYPQLKVKDFGDDDEKDRFETLRKEAMEKLKWTRVDYDELYADCGGGIELEESVQPGSWHTSSTYQEAAPEHAGEQIDEPFFPAKCRCKEKCHLVYTKIDRNRRR